MESNMQYLSTKVFSYR